MFLNDRYFYHIKGNTLNNPMAVDFTNSFNEIF